MITNILFAVFILVLIANIIASIWIAKVTRNYSERLTVTLYLLHHELKRYNDLKEQDDGEN